MDVNHSQVMGNSSCYRSSCCTCKPTLENHCPSNHFLPEDKTFSRRWCWDSDLDGLPSLAMTQNMFTNFEKLPVWGSYGKSHVFYIRYRVFGSRRQINKGLFRCLHQDNCQGNVSLCQYFEILRKCDDLGVLVSDQDNFGIGNSSFIPLRDK